jgi:acetyl esterase/lipase
VTLSDKDKDVAGRPVTLVSNVSEPTITLYSPKGRNTGAAVLVFPGGGYWVLAIDLEGTEVCDWLNSFGVSCILLKYRVPGSGPYPKYDAALQDAQRALRLVRFHATEWGIDPHRVGVLGFSAGGHLAASLGNHSDRRTYAPVDAADTISCRPDFSVLLYPAYLVLPEQGFALDPDIRPLPSTPPAFIVQAEDDPVHVENAANYFLALKNANIPAELHIHAQGGHGFGLRETKLPITRWPGAVEAWLHTIKVLQ